MLRLVTNIARCGVNNLQVSGHMGRFCTSWKRRASILNSMRRLTRGTFAAEVGVCDGLIIRGAYSAAGKCNSSSPIGAAANEVWFDNPKSLAAKYAVARSNGLRGVGVFQVRLPVHCAADTEYCPVAHGSGFHGLSSAERRDVCCVEGWNGLIIFATWKYITCHFF